MNEGYIVDAYFNVGIFFIQYKILRTTSKLKITMKKAMNFCPILSKTF